MLANASPPINQVQCRPVLVVEGAPDCVVVVDHDRILDPHLPYRTTDVLDVVFECELGRVHADHDKTLPVLLRPRAYVWKGPQPVDAGVGPEVDEHDLPVESVGRQARRIEPLPRTG